MATLNADQRHALDEFLNQHQTRAYKMTYAMISHRDDALELVQDTMLKLVQNYAHKSPEEWSLLFFRILQNKIRDYHRRSPLRNLFRHWFSDTTEDESEEQQFPDSQQESPEQHTVQEQNLEQIIQAVQSLPLRQQQTFLLRAWQGFSVSETAFALSISEGSVKTHYSRAQNQLRSIIGDQS
jgi:RNA polymerase sigma-70 factor (ECF subfamily)